MAFYVTIFGQFKDNFAKFCKYHTRLVLFPRYFLWFIIPHHVQWAERSNKPF